MTTEEIQNEINRLQDVVINAISRLTGLSKSDCRLIVVNNPDKTTTQLLQIMLDTLELNDNTINKIERLIRDSQEEE